MRREAKVSELVDWIQRRHLQLPEMQRQYVWRAPRVRDLLDSLYRGYPSGAILLWETDVVVPTREFGVSQPDAPIMQRLLLLDGQQRLTSLSAVLRGEPVKVRGRKRPIEILFNLEHPDELGVVTEVDEDGDDDDDQDDEANGDGPGDDADADDDLQRRFEKMTFIVSTKARAQMPQWVSVSDVFRTAEDKTFLLRAGVKGFDDPRFTRYTERLRQLRAIKDYVYRMDVLPASLGYEEVTEIFVRVNSLGAKLRSSDLALAQITAKWRGSLELFQGFQQKCAERGFDMELGLFLKTMVAFATGQSRFRTVGGLGEAKLREAWEQCQDGTEFAVNFLTSNLKIDSPVLLSSPFLLVTLAVYGARRGYEIAPKESALLARYALLANAKGRYSRGSSETILDQDLAVMREGGAKELMDRLELQVGRLDIDVGELEGRTKRSALFKTMFLAFRAAGARDWRSDLAIALDHSGAQHKLQFHHIFPKALLKKGHAHREIDDIANLAFVSGRTNRAITDKPPEKYLPPLLEKLGEKAFAAQAIPTDPQLWRLDAYPEFLAARRKLIAARLNEFLGVES
jgi:hypothetical protein